MMGALARKVRQVMADPALRRYLLERALGRMAPPSAFVSGHPPYLPGLVLAGRPQPPDFSVLPDRAPVAPLELDLPGCRVLVDPADPGAPFRAKYADIETFLALHRFAWLPLLGDAVDPAWVGALWHQWRRHHGQPGPGWDWHPYTAAERAINLLDYGRRQGLPGPVDDSLAVLAAHAPAIAARLEYGGPHYTGNHLANNGRGLYRIGLDLGWDEAAEMGLRILTAEAERIFAPSGILREGSSHYHLLLTRNYVSCWLAACRHRRPEADFLAGVAGRAMAVARHLLLPGGLPLVGDISPDCPPAHLTADWAYGLPMAEAAALAALPLPDLDISALAADGWLRGDFGPWSGLWHAAPQGWPFMPGHGHHDLGSFELHWRGQPLFIDPGRGAYGETGDAALYRSAAVHNGLQLDGADPTPPNRPYYDDSFRKRIGGDIPALSANPDRVRLVHHGFRAQGADRLVREWHFSDSRLEIRDAVDGNGHHKLSRHFVTPFPVRRDGTDVLVDSPAGTVRVRADAVLTVAPLSHWIAYGRAAPATAIVAEVAATLPWQGLVSIDAV
jgi:hypothetical protein